MSFNKLKLASIAFTLSFLVNLSAFGDDLEIYLGTNNSQFTYKPNVLFIMDSSGSMSNKDSTQLSRMQRVQSALNQALAGATNINAGLMRFSDHGGPILYPVTDIDMPLPPEIVLNTKTSKDDAFELNNVVNVTDDEIKLTNGTNLVTSLTPIETSTDEKCSAGISWRRLSTSSLLKPVLAFNVTRVGPCLTRFEYSRPVSAPICVVAPTPAAAESPITKTLLVSSNLLSAEVNTRSPSGSGSTAVFFLTHNA